MIIEFPNPKYKVGDKVYYLESTYEIHEAIVSTIQIDYRCTIEKDKKEEKAYTSYEVKGIHSHRLDECKLFSSSEEAINSQIEKFTVKNLTENKNGI